MSYYLEYLRTLHLLLHPMHFLVGCKILKTVRYQNLIDLRIQPEMQNITTSIVIPVYSGSKYLHELFRSIQTLKFRLESSDSIVEITEVIFVDDASIDSSSVILDELASNHSWVSVLSMGRNFGQHAATVAGILHSDGDWIVTMDEDLQHPPIGLIPLFKKVVETKCDVVYALSSEAVHENYFRDYSSKIYKRLLQTLSNNKYIRNSSSFRLIRGSVARAASSACGHETYFDIALTWFTSRFETVSMDLKDTRFIGSGISGYSIFALFSHARRLLVSSNLKVLRVGAIFGFSVTCLSLVGALVLVIAKIRNPELVSIQGWSSLILVIATFGGLGLMFFGIVLEYLSLLVQKAHGRPVFHTINRSSDETLSMELLGELFK